MGIGAWFLNSIKIITSKPIRLRHKQIIYRLKEEGTMKLLNSLIVVSAFLFFTSCSSVVNRSQLASSIDLQVTSKMAADIKVDTRRVLKGSAQQVVYLGFLKTKEENQFADGVTYNGGGQMFSLFGEGIVGETKAAAALRAVKSKKGIDVLVSPQYTVKVDSKLFGMYKKVTVKVKGYAGMIKGIRNINQK